MTFSLFRSHWVFSTAFLLLSLIGGQQVSAEECTCSPGEYEFQINLKHENPCDSTTITVNEGIEAVSCYSPPIVLNFLEVSEWDGEGKDLNQQVYSMPIEDGDTFVYTRPDSMRKYISQFMQITLSTSVGDHLYTIAFTKECNISRVLSEGQKIGVLEIVRLGNPQTPEMCVEPTPAPSEPCSDDPNFDLDPENPGENCAWVAEKPQTRCTLDDDIPAACQRTCKAECKCVNDPNFMHVDDHKQEGCDWVKDNLNRCNQDGVGPSCPEVCNPYCTKECSNDRYFMRNNDPLKSCDWITEKSASRCTLDPQVSLSCPATCSSDCCSDTQNFKFNGERSKNCNWVADNPEVRCPKRSSTGESVADNCPSVCNPFCSQRKNLRG